MPQTQNIHFYSLETSYSSFRSKMHRARSRETTSRKWMHRRLQTLFHLEASRRLQCHPHYFLFHFFPYFLPLILKNSLHIHSTRLQFYSTFLGSGESSKLLRNSCSFQTLLFLFRGAFSDSFTYITYVLDKKRDSESQ